MTHTTHTAHMGGKRPRNVQRKYPAADWVIDMVGTRPYVLVSDSSSKVPGLHAPLADNVHTGGVVCVVYSSVPSKRYDGEAVARLLRASSRVPRAWPVCVALEAADQTTQRDALFTQVPHFVGRSFTSKRDLVVTLRLALATTPPDIDAIEAVLKKFNNAPGPFPNGKKELRVLEKAEGVAAARHYRHPTKRDLREYVAAWTTGHYAKVQGLRRGVQYVPNANNAPPTNAGLARQINAGIARYMNSLSLKSPAMPPKIRNMATGSEIPTLYRGISMSVAGYRAMARRRHLDDAGYLSFTRSEEYARVIGARMNLGVLVVFRLNVRSVPRGVPWVWFAGDHETGGSDTPRLYHKSFDAGNNPFENEVLLPPGTLRVIKDPVWVHPPRGGSPYILADVAYERASTRDT